MKNIKNIYVCASFEDAPLVKEIEKQLIKKEFEITSNWTDHIHDSEMLKYMDEDIEGIQRADLLLVWHNGRNSGGKLIEIGMALQKGIPVYLFGNPLSNIFRFRINYHKKQRFVDDIVKVIEGLRQ